MQIQCNIISQDQNTVTYQLIDSQDKELYTMEKADIEKIYPHTEDIVMRTESMNESQKTEVKSNDIIVLQDDTKLEVILVEVADKQVKYRKANNPNGPLFVKEIANISSIIYANGEKDIFNSATIKVAGQSPSQVKTLQQDQQQIVQPSQQQDTSTRNKSVEDFALARVENFSGVYVFTDCSPIAEYEVLGEVSSSLNQKEDESFFMSTGGIGGMMLMSGGDSATPQYTDIRSSLIVNAVLANRQVEGLIIKLPKAGEGSALMIKFKEGTTDRSLARVNSHMGIWVFVDNKPINQYTSVGFIKNAKAGSADYNVIRNKLIKLCSKKFPSAQGIIPHLVSGGHDSGEAIKF